MINDKENRVEFIDVAKGIAIILMIIGHVVLNGIERNIIFSFHMPLFIIVSGFLFHEKPIKQEIKNLFFKLFLPTTILIISVFFLKNVSEFGFWDTLSNCLKVITVCWSHKWKIDYSFDNTGVLWFIYALIIVRLLFLLNKKIAKDNDIFLLFVVLIESFVGYLVGINGYWLPWSIDVALACMIFYYIGYIFNKYSLLNKICEKRFNLILIFIIWIIGVNFSSVEIAIRKYPEGLWSFVTAIAGSIVFLDLSMIIKSKLKKCTKALSWCGRNSLYILFGHYVELAFIEVYVIIDNSFYQRLSFLLYKVPFSIAFAFLVVKISNLIYKYFVNARHKKAIDN